MNKILYYLLVFSLLGLLGCDYKPVLSKKNYEFSINVKEISGDEKINSIIINHFNNLKGNEKKYYINLSSKKEKKIISKDSKGDPSIFELEINVNYNLEEDGEIITRKFSCKHNCAYCPNEKAHEGNGWIDQPRSYLYSEPAVLRANANDFDPMYRTWGSQSYYMNVSVNF